MNREKVAKRLVSLAKQLMADEFSWSNPDGKFTPEQVEIADRLLKKARLDMMFEKMLRKIKAASWTPGSRKGFILYPENIVLFLKTLEEFGWKFDESVGSRKIYRNPDSDIVVVVFGKDFAFFAV